MLRLFKFIITFGTLTFPNLINKSIAENPSW